MNAIINTDVLGVPKRQGKVRDVYEFGDRLLIVATDRISAFDYILPTGIPDKGKLLTRLSLFWFDFLGEENHLLSDDPTTLPLPEGTDVSPLLGRSMVVKKTEVIPVECIARGYLSGSGWNEYRESQSICGVPLPAGLKESEQLPEPIFTPTTKAEAGHDLPITFAEVEQQIGTELARTIRDKTLSIYQRAADYARSKGIILADTKFEFGILRESGAERVILIDEVLTPDSSRFWPANEYEPGRTQNSFDKQYVRNWLLQSDWDRNSPPPELPEDVVKNTRAKYQEACEMLSR